MAKKTKKSKTLIIVSSVLLVVLVVALAVLIAFSVMIANADATDTATETCIVDFTYYENGSRKLFTSITVNSGEEIGENMPTDVPYADKGDYCYTFEYWGILDELGDYYEITAQTVIIADTTVYAVFKENGHICSICLDDYQEMDGYVPHLSYRYKCERCESYSQSVKFHSYEGQFVGKDKSGHPLIDYMCKYHDSEGKSVRLGVVYHTYNSDGICTICGDVRHVHNFIDGYCRECNEYKFKYKVIVYANSDGTITPGGIPINSGSGNSPDDPSFEVIEQEAPDNPDDPNKPTEPEIVEINSNKLGFLTWDGNTVISSSAVNENIDYNENNMFPPEPGQLNDAGERCPNVSVFFEHIAIAHAFDVKVERADKAGYVGAPQYGKVFYLITVSEKGVLPISALKFGSLITRFADSNLVATVSEYLRSEPNEAKYLIEVSHKTDTGLLSDDFEEKYMHNTFVTLKTTCELTNKLDFSRALRAVDLNGERVESDIFPVAQIVDLLELDGEYYWQFYLNTNFDYTIEELTATYKDAEYAITKIGKSTLYGRTYFIKADEENTAFGLSFNITVNSAIADELSPNVKFYSIGYHADIGNMSTASDREISTSQLSRYGIYYRIYEDEETGHIVFDYYCTAPRVMSIVVSKDYLGREQIEDAISTIVAFPNVGILELNLNAEQNYIVVRILTA